MKFQYRTMSVALLSAISLAAFAGGPKVPYTHEGIDTRIAEQALPQHTPNIKWVSIEQIKDSIKNLPPMNVSFDIDDTVLASSGCFQYGKQKYSPNDFSYLKNQLFWDEINAGCDKYSLPKNTAKALIKMHQDRGDKIYFITGRTSGKNEKVTEILKDALEIKDMSPVNFMGGKPHTTQYDKTPAILAHKISIHYGDSDDDILAAKEAGIRGIRLLRATNSNYTPFPKAGGYGEEVLINSSH